MTVHAKKTSLIKTILIAVTAFVLTGCRTNITIEMHADGSVRTEIITEDDRDTMREINQTCAGLHTGIKPLAKFIAYGKMEDITPPGGHLKCRLTSTEQIADEMKLIDEGTTYKIHVTPSNIKKYPEGAFTATSTIIMPGKVLKTTVGKIDGNKVVIEGLDYSVQGFTIVSEKSGGTSQPSPSASRTSNPTTDDGTGAKPPSRNDSGDGFPAWGWGLAGGGILAVIAGAWLVLGRKRRTVQAPTTSPNQAPVVPSTLAQQAQPYAPGQQATNPTHYPRNNTQAAPPSGYGYNAPPPPPQAPTPDHTQDHPDTRYRPR